MSCEFFKRRCDLSQSVCSLTIFGTLHTIAVHKQQASQTTSAVIQDIGCPPHSSPVYTLIAHSHLSLYPPPTFGCSPIGRKAPNASHHNQWPSLANLATDMKAWNIPRINRQPPTLLICLTRMLALSLPLTFSSHHHSNKISNQPQLKLYLGNPIPHALVIPK